jgi:hypothetical protein
MSAQTKSIKTLTRDESTGLCTQSEHFIDDAGRPVSYHPDCNNELVETKEICDVTGWGDKHDGKCRVYRHIYGAYSVLVQI